MHLNWEFAWPWLNLGNAFATYTGWIQWYEYTGTFGGIFKTVIEENIKGIYNAVAPNPVTNKALTKEAATLLDKPLILPNVPGFALKLLLGEMAAVVLESQKVSSEKTETVYSFKYTHLHNALVDLLE